MAEFSANVKYPRSDSAHGGMKAPLVAVVLVSLAFAGCTGSEPAARTDASGLRPDPCAGCIDKLLPTEPAFDFDAGIPAPLWNVGDWWQYKVEYFGALPKTYDAKIVVYAEDSEAWYLTSDNREMILRAGFNHYPTLGKVKKSDLGEFIHDQEVSFFAWPMKNGTRTGTFRDFEAAWSTTATELATGKGPVPGFASVMRRTSDSAVIAHHGWSPLTKWFTNFTFSFRGGEPDVTFTLQDWGSNHTGELPVVTLVDKVHRLFPVANAAAPGAPSAETRQDFKVDVGGSGLLIGYFAGGAPGQYEWSVSPVGSTYAGGYPAGPDWVWVQPGSEIRFEWIELTNVAATQWTAAGEGATNGSGFLFGEVYELHDQNVTLPAP